MAGRESEIPRAHREGCPICGIPHHSLAPCPPFSGPGGLRRNYSADRSRRPRIRRRPKWLRFFVTGGLLGGSAWIWWLIGSWAWEKLSG